MKKQPLRILATLLAATTLLAACKPASNSIPSFSLAWSEYPSWSTFGVAHAFDLINGNQGELGPIEKKWNVDIVLKQAEYDPCIAFYGSSQCDAVCITDMDVLNPSLTRPSVIILPTSTSHGGDACIVPNTITNVTQLKGKKVFGLAKSVSEYCFVRNLQILGEKEGDYQFSNMDPGAAAVAMQQKQPSVEAIVVWNPFVIETLNKRADATVLFDSSTLPNEIIDTVAIAQASLDKPGGKEFACAIIDTFYQVSKRMADPATADETLLALGQKFSNLNLESMKKVVTQTRFYSTPDEGIKLFSGPDLPAIMKKVVDFCVSHDITQTAPSVGYGTRETAPNTALRFDPSYMEMVRNK